MTLYAAYAANLDPREMASRCPHSPLRGTGWLVGWRLTFGGEEFGWNGALATVVEDEKEQVFVSLYDVAPADEPLLDQWEGADIGLYRKIHVRVQTLDGGVTAITYVLDAYEGGLPSARYLGMLADAAEAAGAPDDYTEGLRQRPCRSTGFP
ncbi:gamma-glutamylcyclotransferase [Thermasporomyces composti]|uniref:AIG2 family protein n=1 Tax=Thermasporomyces composti TaxID=696763 RepID=A0A3D9V7H5_THECX|nr:gamma-glutamylcyclotransferase [Thermasporomyces composti]REF37457.1 AIG2 family protein [Thermasporomyces composti]